MIHAAGIILWVDFGLGQDNLVLFWGPLGKRLKFNMEPLGFIGPVMYGVCPHIYPLDPVGHYGLDKVGELVLGRLWYILPGDIVRPVVSRFGISHVLKSYSGITDHLYLMLLFSIFTTIPYGFLYLLNIRRWLNNINSRNYGVYIISWMRSLNCFLIINSLGFCQSSLCV